MNKKQTACTRKFLRSDATPLSHEAVEEISNIPNAERVMCKKYRIGASRYKGIINNQMPSELSDEWRSIIKSVYFTNNKNSLLSCKVALRQNSKKCSSKIEPSQNLETTTEVSAISSDTSSTKNTFTKKNSQKTAKKNDAENYLSDISMLESNLENLVKRTNKIRA